MKCCGQAKEIVMLTTEQIMQAFRKRDLTALQYAQKKKETTVDNYGEKPSSSDLMRNLSRGTGVYFDRIGHKPRNDAEALKCCQWCRHLKNDNTCDILGQITVESRHECYLRGLADVNFCTRGGKVPQYPPCE